MASLHSNPHVSTRPKQIDDSVASLYSSSAASGFGMKASAKWIHVNVDGEMEKTFCTSVVGFHGGKLVSKPQTSV